MPRYEFDPSKATAAQEVFPKDDYEVSLGSPKSFIRKNQKNEDSYGIRIQLTIEDGPFKSKHVPYTCYLHSEGAQSMTKRFQLAVFGFKGNQAGEKEFDAQHGSEDWSYDPEAGTCGEAWNKMAGARVIAVLDVGKDLNGEPQQNFKSWRPINA